MKKRSLIVPFIWMMASTLSAQDMPPLPDLPNQGNQAPATGSGPASTAMPPLPDQSSTAAAPAAPPSNSGSAAMPPLPDQSSAPASNAAPANPPVPGDQSQSPSAMPPLPGDQGQPAANNPPAPPGQGQAATTEQAPSATEAPAQEKPKAKTIPPWKISKYRPNAIFDGWVLAKGGNESSRLAWTSQEVLNTFEFKGYKTLPEEGAYDGQGKKQWRRFTFRAPRSKQIFHVYIKGVGKKVWLRVRPGEPAVPDSFTLAQVQKMRKTDLAALHLLQKKFKGRLRPGRIIVSWEPSHPQQTAGEEDE